MAVNKIEFNGSTLIDLTGDTVTADAMLSGVTAHNNAGVRITGTAVIPENLSDLNNDMVVSDFTNDANYTTLSTVIDLIYPVGSYLHTSDGNYDPNVSLGGTWSLLGEGQVLLSAGSTYTAGTEYGGNTKSYTPAGSVGSHTLTTNEIPAHTHGSKTLSGTFYLSSVANAVVGATGIVSNSAGSNGSYTGNNTNSRPIANFKVNATHEHTSVGGGEGHTHEFTGTTATLDVMQKSTATYIWHRTA